jgi:hypothetical protein
MQRKMKSMAQAFIEQVELFEADQRQYKKLVE